jgi:hypothetical protein
MAAFAGEMPRQSEDVAAAYAAGLRDYLAPFVEASAGPDAERATAQQARQKALVEFSMLAGALVLSRSVARANRKLSDEFLDAANAALG